MNDLVAGVRVEGDVRFGEQSIYSPRTDVNALRRRIGMVFQKSNPFPKSIFDNVAALDPIATQRIEELMQDLKSRYTLVIV